MTQRNSLAWQKTVTGEPTLALSSLWRSAVTAQLMRTQLQPFTAPTVANISSVLLTLELEKGWQSLFERSEAGFVQGVPEKVEFTIPGL